MLENPKSKREAVLTGDVSTSKGYVVLLTEVVSAFEIALYPLRNFLFHYILICNNTTCK